RQTSHQFILASQGFDVVARTSPIIVLVGDLEFAVLVEVHQHEFCFETKFEDKALFFGYLHLVLQDGSRAICPRFALDCGVTDDVRQTFLPRHDAESSGIWNNFDVRALRALSDFSSCKACEAYSLTE